MSKTVALVSDTGLLVDALGNSKETNQRYAKFAQRLIGADGTTAVINYGWNGASKLAVNANGEQGQLITLNAETVVVPGDLNVGGKPLKTIIDSCTDLAICGIRGTDHEIDVTIEANSDSDSSASSEQSRLTCTIGLSAEVLDRILQTEQTLKDLFRFKEVYTAGDGLKLENEGTENRLSVKLGTGLKFEYPESSSESYDESDSSSSEEYENAAITLDMDDVPTQGSLKPVTSGGVYDAIQGGGTAEYFVGIDPTTGNMTLYHKE